MIGIGALSRHVLPGMSPGQALHEARAAHALVDGFDHEVVSIVINGDLTPPRTLAFDRRVRVHPSPSAFHQGRHMRCWYPMFVPESRRGRTLSVIAIVIGDTTKDDGSVRIGMEPSVSFYGAGERS